MNASKQFVIPTNSTFFVSLVTFLCISVNAAPMKVENTYRSFCQTCHGATLQGGMGSSLVDSALVKQKDVSSLFRIIKEGVRGKGMPAWGPSLDDGQIHALIAYISEKAQELEEVKGGDHSLSEVRSAAGHSFSLHQIAEVSGELWAMTFLPDGRLLANIKSSGLKVLDGERASAVEGLPKAETSGQAGYFDVQLDPDYNKNGLIYISYAEPSREGSMTRVDRGTLSKKGKHYQWKHDKAIFALDHSQHINTHHHYGARVSFKEGFMYVTVGDRGRRPRAQDLDVANGKVHRVKLDATIPSDNPFTKQAKAVKSIWSYGHRNPQGMSVHPQTGELWVAEHGPRGGDEINRVQKGLNYGWPVITFGINYNGTPITDKTEQSGMEQPVHYWVPSIAVSAIEFYTGDKFARWKHQLLVGSLGREELRLLNIQGDKVVSDELVLKGLGRIREVGNTPDGFPFVSLLEKGGNRTKVYRLQPAK